MGSAIQARGRDLLMIDLQCPSCQCRCTVDDALAGKSVRCSNCREVFTAPAPVAARETVAEAAADDGIHAGPAPSRPAALEKTSATTPPAVPSSDRGGAGRRSVKQQRGSFTVWIVACVAAALVMMCGACVVGGTLLWSFWPHTPPAAGPPLAGQAGPPLAPAVGPEANPALGWTMDLARMKAPDQPVAGTMLGAPFRADRVQMQNTGLHIVSGPDM